MPPYRWVSFAVHSAKSSRDEYQLQPPWTDKRIPDSHESLSHDLGSLPVSRDIPPWHAARGRVQISQSTGKGDDRWPSIGGRPTTRPESIAAAISTGRQRGCHRRRRRVAMGQAWPACPGFLSDAALPTRDEN